jgi:hypothetical protein
MPWKEQFVHMATGLGDARAPQCYDITSLVVRLHKQMPHPSQSVTGDIKATTQNHPKIIRAHIVFTSNEASKQAYAKSGHHPNNQHV